MNLYDENQDELPPVNLPGGKTSKRVLTIIYIVDCSDSMNAEGNIHKLNQAMREVIPLLQEVEREHPQAELKVQVLKFSDGAQWVISEPTPISQFIWTDLTASGKTDMGMALEMVAAALKFLPRSGFSPLLILLSDGQPTDDFAKGIEVLLHEPWGDKATRVPIAIGDDADMQTLAKFASKRGVEGRAIKVDETNTLKKVIQWATVNLSHDKVTMKASDDIPNPP